MLFQAASLKIKVSGVRFQVSAQPMDRKAGIPIKRTFLSTRRHSKVVGGAIFACIPLFFLQGNRDLPGRDSLFHRG